MFYVIKNEMWKWDKDINNTNTCNSLTNRSIEMGRLALQNSVLTYHLFSKGFDLLGYYLCIAQLLFRFDNLQQ